jgi:hypothetical protein
MYILDVGYARFNSKFQIKFKAYEYNLDIYSSNFVRLNIILRGLRKNEKMSNSIVTIGINSSKKYDFSLGYI